MVNVTQAPSSSTFTLLDQAVEYAEDGLGVIPLLPGRTTPQRIEDLVIPLYGSEVVWNYWRRHPDCNIGIVTVPRGSVKKKA